MKKQYLTLMITLSAVSFSAFGMENTTKQERNIIDFAQKLAKEHRADCYNALEARHQEQNILFFIGGISHKQEKDSFAAFNKTSPNRTSSRKWCPII